MSKEWSQVTDFQDRFLFSLSQLSSAFGPARETIGKRLREAGVLPQGKRRGHDVYHIGAAAQAILAADVPSFEGVDDPDKLAPKDRLDWYKGQNEKIKFEREVKLVIPQDEVSREFAQVVKLCVRTMETLPDILERKCHLPPEAISHVEHECDSAREELANLLEE